MKETRRLMTILEAAEYIGMGTTCAKQWFRQIGAVRYFGRRVLFDRAVIDAALNGAQSGDDISQLDEIDTKKVKAI
jgi:hypothetical protein